MVLFGSLAEAHSPSRSACRANHPHFSFASPVPAPWPRSSCQTAGGRRKTTMAPSCGNAQPGCYWLSRYLGRLWPTELAVHAFRAGARGLFCLGDSSFQLFCECIERVHRGEIWATTQQLNYLLDSVC